MMKIAASDARATLPEILDRVEAGEEVTITRHGQPVAVVVRPDSLRARRGEPLLARAAETVGGILDAGRRRPLSRMGGISRDRADELITGIRADRDAR